MPTPYVRSSLRLAALAALLAGAAVPALAQQAQTGQPAQTEASDPAQQPAASEAPAAAETPAAPAQQAQPEAQAQPQQSQPQQAQPQAPQPQVTATHGDWTILCLDGAPPCIMQQSGYTADGREVMQVSIRRIPTQQTQQGTVEAMMDVRVPLGVLLRDGLSLQIDSAEAQRGQFSICVSEGCLMREPLPNAMIAGLKKGATAKFGFVGLRGQGGQKFDVDISLSGFTAAYNALGEN